MAETDIPTTYKQIVKFGLDKDGFFGLICSSDNGKTVKLIVGPDGLVLHPEDGDKIWNLIESKVQSAIDAGGSQLTWSKISDKPDLVLEKDLPDFNQFAKKDELPDTSGLAKAATVDAVKTTAESALSTAEKAQSTADANSKALADKADKSEIPDISGLAKKSDIPVLPDLNSYALKSELPSLSGYARLSDIPSVAGLVKEAELADYAKKSDLPNLSGYVKVSDLIDYAKKTDIPQSLSWDKVTGKPDVALKSELPSITGLAKETDLASVKATAESAESKAEQAQSTANSKVSSNYQWSVVAMDYNDIKTGGVYYNAENGDNYHAPAGDWGYLIVNGRGNGACSQLYLGDNTAGLYWRTFNGNNWSNWVKVASTNDLSGLVSQSALNQVKDLLNEQIAKKADASAIPSLDGYAKLTDIPSVTGLVKEAELADYAKKTDIPKMPDLSGYVTASSLMDYVKRTELPDFTQFAKKSEVPADVAHTSDLANYALKSEIPKMPDLSGYALKSDLPIVPTDLVHTSDMNQVKADVSQAKQEAEKAATLANNVSLKFDTSKYYTYKAPNAYTNGITLEWAYSSNIGLDEFKDNGSTISGFCMLTTKIAVVGSLTYARQKAEVVSGSYPYTFERNGLSSGWSPWHQITAF